MPELKRAVVNCEVKEIAPRVLRFTSSDETQDRMKDIIKAEGWQLDNFMKNPVFLWVHDYTQPPIGKTIKIEIKGKKLITDVEFADADTYKFADTIYRLYKGGFLNAVSVGFMPLDWEGKQGEDDVPKWSGNVFTKQELLEHSAVPVPANPNALTQAKSLKVISGKELKELAKSIQKLAEEPDPPEPPATAPPAAQDKAAAATPPAEPAPSPEPRTYSQASISDEIDYLFAMVKEVGISPENTELLRSKLAENKIELRAPGGDMPVVITQKGGTDDPTPDEVFEAVKQAIKDIKGEK